MQIILKQPELSKAVALYLTANGITGAIGKIDFTATRGDQGLVTTIDLADENEAEEAPKRATRKPSPKKVAKAVAPVAEKVADEPPFAVDDVAEDDKADATADVDSTADAVADTAETLSVPAATNAGNPNSLFGGS